MLPFALFALFAVSAFLITDDIADEPDVDETPDTTGEVVPVDTILEETAPEEAEITETDAVEADADMAVQIDPETGAFQLRSGQTAVGTDGDDIFNLTEDVTYGDDQLSITAGAGNDTIDLMPYNAEDALIDAGDGNDVVNVQMWYGTVEAGAGDDRITIHTGAALVNGGDGDDYITSNSAHTDYSTFYGGAGNDVIDAREMNHVILFGDEGDDTLMTSDHAPSGNGYYVAAHGGEGSDRLIHEAPEQGWSSGRPILFGGEDSDSFEITIVDSAADSTFEDPMPGEVDQSDVVILGDFDPSEDTLQIALEVSDPSYTITSAEIVEEPYRESVDASGTPVYGTETHINVNYEHGTENDRQMTIVVRATGLTWDDITFVGDNIPPVLQPAP